MRPRPLVLLLCLPLLTLALAGCIGQDEPEGTPEPPGPSEAAPFSEAFGAPGRPIYTLTAGPANLTASEPTIGIPWTTDSVFYHAQHLELPAEGGVLTYKVTFDEAGNATWTDVTPPYQTRITLDPMLHADPDTGRIWAGGLAGTCSVMMFSDDDGATWAPTGNMCSGPDFDHQSIGSGPSMAPTAGIAYEHTQYYCGQGGTISCAASHDGGSTWGPFVQEQTECQGFHGHIRVSRITSMMAVPVADCGGELGMLTTTDGLTYTAKTIPDSEPWTNGFDPSLQFGRDQGWLWYGMASEHGIHIALSKDDGDSWATLGQGMDTEPTHYLDVGQFHDPPIVAGTFADVQVGDDDRVAMSFLGLVDNGTADTGFLTSNQIYQCEERQDELIWHYYLATSFDAGRTWEVHRLSQDPVQVGGIYDVLVEGSGDCRNLLDFNDMDIDSQGRVHIAWADGCTAECAATHEPETEGYRDNEARLFRQMTGLGLFAEHDLDAQPQG